MNAEQLIEEIKRLSPDELDKVTEYLSSEDFQDALDTHQEKKEFLSSGDSGSPAKEVFSRLGLQ